MPTRYQVYEICNPLKESILNCVFRTDDFIDTVGHFIAKHFRVDILHAKALQVESTEVDINAYYDQELDENKKVSIELVLITNPNDDHIIINDDLWKLFINRLSDSLAHELIHMRQSRSRNFIPIDRISICPSNTNKDIQYLGIPDEIEAYAHNIADELREQPNPLLRIANPKLITAQESVNLWVYVNTFSKDLNNPVLRKLLKKVYKNLT